MTLTEIKNALAAADIRLTKSLGQNFMHDGNQLRRMIAAAHLTPTDSVLEIGPGLGPLTELLLTKAGKVLAIEKDERLIRYLRQKFATAANLDLVAADAVQFLRGETRDWSGWKIVSNLPYAVGSIILVDLASSRHPPESMVVTLQSEVAERLAASARDSAYGILSLLIQLQYQIAGTFKIPASCFFPQPDVDSACITLTRRPQPLINYERIALYQRLVKRGFSQRRKMMFKLLKLDWNESALAAAFQAVALPPNVRAEQVTLEQFAALAEHLADRNE